ncbi:MAG: FkbM family methyltransferase [Planctomycetes bacterium]|nr:FkbM family methyltransferase [Planctomycetota bacterium]
MKLVARFVEACRYYPYKRARKRNRSIRKQRVQAWYDMNGGKPFCLDYDLRADSVAFDLGGYKGDWTFAVFEKYGCRVHCFEPVRRFADEIEKRFAGNSSIYVHRFGLAEADKKIGISLAENSSSAFKGKRQEDISLVRAADFIAGQSISRIDLMKINIEGGEYDLLEHLIDSGVIGAIADVQVQFHDFVPHAEKRMEEIQRRLSETHELTWQYKFIWENWKLKT